MADQTKILLTDLTFPEGPRWHEGRLWFSDFYAHEVVAVDMAGQRETIVKVPGQPSGLGWTPDGRLLVVSMTDRRLLRLDPGGLVEVADLSALANYHCNDMVVDEQGGAYVGNFGFNSHDGSEFKAADLIRVDPDGAVSVAAEGLAFPNGSVITPDDPKIEPNVGTNNRAIRRDELRTAISVMGRNFMNSPISSGQKASGKKAASVVQVDAIIGQAIRRAALA